MDIEIAEMVGDSSLEGHVIQKFSDLMDEIKKAKIQKRTELVATADAINSYFDGNYSGSKSKYVIIENIKVYEAGSVEASKKREALNTRDLIYTKEGRDLYGLHQDKK